MRRRLYLLRHAKSSWDEPGLVDRERPLAERGRRACAVVAAHIEAAGIEPGAVVCSPAARARETLDRIAVALPPGAERRIEPRVYGADWEQLLEVVRELPDELRSVMLIGHNPGFQDLVLALAAEGEALERVRRKFPTAALATLGFAGDWRRLRPGGAGLEGFVRPKQLA